jgi:CheY-like chemotaxis protein
MTEESRTAVQEDVHIIDSSLTFINDLLRNMLDVHRAAHKELHIKKKPTSVYSDILEPVAAMLYNRGEDFEIQVDCPTDLVVKADKLRLQQIVLNLARNSVKFVTTGFVRLRAAVMNDEVVLYVEDSGPGIPQEKRDQLFNKYQKSLDRLSQGTGIGLAVVRKLIDLMGGDICLDDDYNSGVQDQPGARFVIELKTPPELDSWHKDSGERDEETEMLCVNQSLETYCQGSDDTIHSTVSKHGSCQPILNVVPEREEPTFPTNLKVLFTDDDTLLRRLFVRSLRNFQPTWNVREAASGEAALRIVQEETFDVIFMDQYMASVDQVLLGTETVRALRAQGVTSRICGLSANDMEKPFLAAGADLFWVKPFPCKREALIEVFSAVLGPPNQNLDGENGRNTIPGGTNHYHYYHRAISSESGETDVTTLPV